MHQALPLALPAFNDNYIWLIMHPEKQLCWVVDPGDGDLVVSHLKELGKKCAGILLTHHHRDHQGGVDAIVQEFSCEVWSGTDERCQCDHRLSEGDHVQLGEDGPKLQVIELPGHTLGHIAFEGNGWLFCGDTLFSGGCGKVFEGSYDQMHHSLLKLKNLDADTEVFCAHEYTLSNLQFALKVEPDNKDLQTYFQYCTELRKQSRPTLPSTIGQEIKINPFFRCNQPSIQEAVGQHCHQTLNTDTEVFAELRRWKDQS